MSKKDYQEFILSFESLTATKNIQQAKTDFIRLCEKWEEKYLELMRYLKGFTQQILNFVILPYQVRNYLNTTNLIEGLNRKIEDIRRSSGKVFQK